MSDGSSPRPLPSYETAAPGPAAPVRDPWGWSADEPAPAHVEVPAVPARPRRGSALVIVAVVMSALSLAISIGTVLVLVVIVGLVAADWYGAGEDVGMYAPAFAQGSVKAADGSVVDGVGTYERPAVLGEHILSWPTASGGVVDVTVEEVDWDATAEVAAADPANPPPSPGMVYVQARVDLEYSGPGRVVPDSDLMLSLETSSWFSADAELDVASAAPMWEVGDLVDGQGASVLVVLEMTEGERDSAVLSVETMDGEPLYLAER